MGKITICSLKQDSNYLSEVFRDFFLSSQSEDEYGTIISYKKLAINTKNIYKTIDGFAVGCGTFIYNNKIDSDALEDIYKRFCNNVSELRREIIGSYCIAIYKNRTVTVFIDEMNTYNLYYYFCQDTQRLVITNTYYHIAKLLGNEAIIDKPGFACGWMLQLMNENTIYCNIKKFTSNTVFVFSDSEWRKESVEVKNFDSMSSVSEYLVSKYRGLTQVFQTCGIGMTGGQDSRLNLALMMAIGMKPTLLYGKGNSLQTCTKVEDQDTVNRICRKFNLPKRELDWIETDEEQFDEYLDKYGEYALEYNFNKNIIHEFENMKDIAFVTYGYFGEVYRNVEDIVNYRREQFSAKDYIVESYSKNAIKFIDKRADEEYVAYVEDEVKSICKAKGIDPNNLVKANYQAINTVRRQYTDSNFGNFTNAFVYSFPLFGDISATSFIETIDYTLRDNSKYQMRLIHDLQPELLDIPFFSHIKPRKLNMTTYEITDAGMSVRIKDKIRPFIRNPRMMLFARKIYHLIRRDYKGIAELRNEQLIMRELNERLSGFRYFGLDRSYLRNNGDARKLKRLILLERMVNHAKKDKTDDQVEVII